MVDRARMASPCKAMYPCITPAYSPWPMFCFSQRRLRSKPLPAKLLGALPSTLNKAADLAYEVEQEVCCTELCTGLLEHNYVM